MASNFDLVFAFKDFLGDESAKKIVSDLRYHQILWAFLAKESQYLRVVDRLGNDPALWNVQGIVDVIEQIASDEKESFHDQGLADHPVIEMIECKRDLEKQCKTGSLVSRMVAMIDNNDPKDNVIRKWGTILAYYYQDEKHQREIEDALIDELPDRLKILGFLLKSSGLEKKDAFITRNMAALVSNPFAVRILKQYLEQSGSQEMAAEISNQYLEYLEKPYTEIISEYLTHSHDPEMAGVKLYQEAALLAHELGMEQKAAVFQKYVDTLFTDKKANKNRAGNIENDNLRKALEIYQADNQAARKLCQSFIDINKNKDFSAIGKNTIGYLSANVDEIIGLFCSVNLELDLVILLENLNTYYGHNEILEKKIGLFCSQMGDHARANKYLSPLFGADRLSRQEKISFTTSLMYENAWEKAQVVIGSVNPITENDHVLRILISLKTGRKSEVGRDIGQALNEFPKGRYLQAIEDLIKGRISYRALIEDKYDLFTSSFLFSEIIKYISDPAQPKECPISEPAIVGIINEENGSDLNAEALYNRISSITQHPDQITIEYLIENMIVSHHLPGAREAVLQHASRWPLSKALLKVKAALCLDPSSRMDAGEVLEQMVNYFKPDQEIIKLYGIQLLQSNINDFPYTTNPKKIQEEKLDIFSNLIEGIGVENLSLDNRILNIAILSPAPLSDFLAIASESKFSNDPSKWRIPFSIGYHFHKNKKFDQAIIYLKEAKRVSLEAEVINDLLIDAYVKLDLPKDAVDIIREKSIQGKLPYSLLNEYAKTLYRSDSLSQFLQETANDFDLQNEHNLVRANVAFLRGLDDEAESILFDAEHVIPEFDRKNLNLASVYMKIGKHQAAIRALNKFLSNNQDLDDETIFDAANMYFQLKEYEKSLNLVSLVTKEKVKKGLLKTQIYYQLGEIDDAKTSFLKAIENENQAYADGNEWDLDNIVLVSEFLLESMRKRHVDETRKIFNYLVERAKFQESYRKVALKFALLIGAESALIDSMRDISEIVDVENEDLLIYQINNALNSQHEVEAAELFASIGEKEKSHILYLLQARLQIRNGERESSKAVIAEIHEGFVRADLDQITVPQARLDHLIKGMLLIEVFYALGEFRKAYDIIKYISPQIGSTERLAYLNLAIFKELLEEKIIDDALLIRNHRFRIEEDDLQNLKSINDDEELHQRFEKELAKLQLLIELNPHEKVEQNEKWVELEEHPAQNDLAHAISLIKHEPKQALPAIKNLLISDIENPRLLFAMALANAQLGNTSESYAMACLALEQWPEEYEWDLFAGNIKLKEGNRLSAYTHFKQAEIHNPGADYMPKTSESTGVKLNKIGAKDIPSLLIKARGDMDNGNFKSAKRIKEAILEIDPENIGGKILEGELLASAGEYKEGLNLSDFILEKQPNNIQALELKTQIILKTKNAGRALKFFERYSAKIDLGKTGVILRARLLSAAEGAESACAYLVEEIAVEEEKTDILKDAARQLIHFGHRADKYVAKLLETHTDDPGVLILAGKNAHLTGDLDKAIDYFQQAIKIDPFMGEGYILIAEVLDQKREYDFARITLEQGLDLNPANYALLKYASQYFIKSGRYSSADKYIKSAYTINPEDKELHKLMQMVQNR